MLWPVGKQKPTHFKETERESGRLICSYKRVIQLRTENKRWPNKFTFPIQLPNRSEPNAEKSHSFYNFQVIYD